MSELSAGLTSVRRGQVLRPPFTVIPTPNTRATRAEWWKLVVLLALLPMYYQAFQYMIDIMPLYTLSKGWPLITFPIALWAVFALRLPYTTYYVVLIAYTVGLSPALSMVQLYNDFVEAAATTTKIWSFSFYFSLSALLYWLQPNGIQLRRAILILGTLTFVVQWILWFTVPESAYMYGPKISQIFYWDLERGFRIVLPMGMGLVSIFYVARLFASSPRVWHALVIAAAIGSMVFIYKQRLATLSAIVITVFAATSGLRARAPLIAWGGMLAGVGLAVLGLQALPESAVQGSLGASLSIRETSVQLAWDFIRDDPLRLLFGVGATTNVSAITFQQILNNENFFTTDIGWIGVLLEYGLIGSALIGGAYLLGIIITHKAAKLGDPLMQALSDWALYLIMVTVVYSVIYTPGEIMTATAIAVYTLRKQGRTV